MIKPGVSLRGLSPQMALAHTIINDIYNDHGEVCVITSGCDGRHSEGSRHYSGQALDYRLLHNTSNDLIANEIQDRLGDQFDVVLENDHIHVEFDP